MSHRSIRCVAIALVLGWTSSALAVDFDWATIGQPGNPPPNPPPYAPPFGGSVAYVFQISRYETTNSQYAEFLNAVAASDPKALYDPSMTSDALNGGILRSGASGSFSYAVKPGFASKPINYVSFWDALRFANWLHNGEPTGAQNATTTEDGAYTLTPAGIANNSVVRNPGARVFLPTADEWWKSGNYAGGSTYFMFPTSSNDWPLCSVPTPVFNAANCGPGAGRAVDVGSYPGSPSPSGTFDQKGNVTEWLEMSFAAAPALALRGLGGGSFDEDVFTHVGGEQATWQVRYVGFRVARSVPGVPAIGPIGALGLAALLLGIAPPWRFDSPSRRRRSHQQ